MNQGHFTTWIVVSPKGSENHSSDRRSRVNSLMNVFCREAPKLTKRARCQGNIRPSWNDDGIHNLLVATVYWKQFLQQLNKNGHMHFNELQPRDSMSIKPFQGQDFCSINSVWWIKKHIFLIPWDFTRHQIGLVYISPLDQQEHFDTPPPLGEGWWPPHPFPDSWAPQPWGHPQLRIYRRDL